MSASPGKRRKFPRPTLRILLELFQFANSRSLWGRGSRGLRFRDGQVEYRKEWMVWRRRSSAHDAGLRCPVSSWLLDPCFQLSTEHPIRVAEDLRLALKEVGLQLIVEVQDSFSDLLFYDADFGQIIFYIVRLRFLTISLPAAILVSILYAPSYCTAITSLSRFEQLDERMNNPNLVVRGLGLSVGLWYLNAS